MNLIKLFLLYVFIYLLSFCFLLISLFIHALLLLLRHSFFRHGEFLICFPPGHAKIKVSLRIVHYCSLRAGSKQHDYYSLYLLITLLLCYFITL
jgi:hypothetical protein